MSLPPNVPPRTLRVGVLSRLSSTFPWEIRDHVTALALMQVYETPYVAPPDGSALTPALFSEAFRTEGDALTVSAPVRPGALFSDGTPCTAAHVADYFARVRDLTSRAEVRAREGRVEFRLKEPEPHFATFMTQPFCGVALESGGRLLGTGPFLAPEPLDAEDPLKAGRLLLRVNPHASKAPSIGGILFEVYPDADALLAAVHAGEVHLTYGLTFAHLAKLRGAPVFPKTLDGSSTAILFLNTQSPALADARVRRALCAAISRTEIARVSFGALGLGFAASGLLPPFMKKETPVGAMDGSPVQARQILSDSGLPAPAKLRLLLTWGPKPYLPDPPAAATAGAESLRTLGSEVEIVKTRDRAEYAGYLQRGDYDLVLAGWIADTAIASDFVDSLLASSMVVTGSAAKAAGYNLSRWQDPETDRALERFRRSQAVKDLLPIARTVQDQGLLVPLMHGKLIAVTHRDVRRFQPSPLGRSILADVEI